MQRGKLLYTGKAKSIYATDNPDLVIIDYRDDTSAGDGAKIEQLENKGKINNQFNAFIMQLLQREGIETHFVELLNANESVVKHLKMSPVECVVRNLAAGSICRRLGVEEGLELTPATFEFFLKNDELHDPMINASLIETFGWATPAEVADMKTQTFKINDILKQLFADAGLILADFKLEYGRSNIDQNIDSGKMILGDEFSPDGCRIWDAKTRKKLDKDRFRQDLGGVTEGYIEVAERLGMTLDLT